MTNDRAFVKIRDGEGGCCVKKENQRKPWKSPKLIVLVSPEPAEIVLTSCKFSGNPSGPQGKKSACNMSPCSVPCAILLST